MDVLCFVNHRGYRLITAGAPKEKKSDNIKDRVSQAVSLLTAMGDINGETLQTHDESM